MAGGSQVHCHATCHKTSGHRRQIAFERLSLGLPERGSQRLVQQGVLTAYWRSPRALVAQVAFRVINPLLRGVR